MLLHLSSGAQTSGCFANVKRTRIYTRLAEQTRAPSLCSCGPPVLEDIRPAFTLPSLATNLSCMTPPKRSRLSPEKRRTQLLDSAKTLILAKGLSSFTMESLAREAGVSHPLICKYFDTRLSLLHALLERESSHFNRELREQVLAVIITNWSDCSSQPISPSFLPTTSFTF